MKPVTLLATRPRRTKEPRGVALFFNPLVAEGRGVERVKGRRLGNLMLMGPKGMLHINIPFQVFGGGGVRFPAAAARNFACGLGHSFIARQSPAIERRGRLLAKGCLPFLFLCHLRLS